MRIFFSTVGLVLRPVHIFAGSYSFDKVGKWSLVQMWRRKLGQFRDLSTAKRFSVHNAPYFRITIWTPICPLEDH